MEIKEGTILITENSLRVIKYAGERTEKAIKKLLQEVQISYPGARAIQFEKGQQKFRDIETGHCSDFDWIELEEDAE